MKALLFGNGLNRLNGYTTWDDLVKRINDKDDKHRIPNTLHYEAQILQQPYKVTEAITYNGESVTYNDDEVTFTVGTESSFKNGVAHEMKGYVSNEVYQRVASIEGIDHYLTTNYDQVLKQTLEGIGYSEVEHVRAENTYSLRRRHSLQNTDGALKHIWNIHGDIDAPQTIMLGLYQYCGSVGRISEYMNGKYKYKREKQIQTVPKLLDHLKDGIEEPFSWIDLFYIADIYMIGFGLLYDEIDLWWVLTRRKRLIRQGYDIKNRGFYLNRVDPNGKSIMIHAKLNDPGLLRYAINGDMPIVWWGNIKELSNGALVAGVYPTFYLDEECKVTRGGVSFYESNDEGKTWNILSRIPFSHLIAGGRKVIRFPLNGTWIDIGNPQEYKRANELVNHLH